METSQWIIELYINDKSMMARDLEQTNRVSIQNTVINGFIGIKCDIALWELLFDFVDKINEN